MSSAPKSTISQTAHLWLALAMLAAAVWLWINLCRFPSSVWNDVRLAPVFMAAEGTAVYTLPGDGILTTWMYGPVPLWIWWPATLAGDVVEAIMTAGVLNLLITVAVLAATCRWWPAEGLAGLQRGFCFAACLALWPDHPFRFLQADNVAVALGLAGNLLLATASSGSPHRVRLWIAAFATAAALGCKQTTLGLPVAQIAWLWFGAGRAAALGHLCRVAGAGMVLLTIASFQFGFAELWFGLVTVPGALPSVENWPERLANLAPHLALQAGVPLILIAMQPGIFFRGDSALPLATLTFLASLPLGLLGTLSTGGTINSFQGYQLFLPAFVLTAIHVLRPPRTHGLFALLTVLVVTIRIGLADFAPSRPAVAEIHKAVSLIKSRPGELWLPWNPLVTRFAEGRFDHAEDGIYVRFITGYPVSLRQARAGTPPNMKAMAFPSLAMQWEVASRLAPPDALHTRDGQWLLISWP